MKQARLIAALLLLSVVLSLFACNSTVTPPTESNPTTIPTESTVFLPPTTEETQIPTSEPPTELTEPPTEPPTESPTEAPTQAPTNPPAPTQPKPVETMPPEPWSSENVTIGDEVPGITAKKAFVYDCATQSYLYMKSEADAKVYPASITKLMNVYTALKYVDKNAVVTIGADMLSIVPGDTSLAKLYTGERLTVENLIKGVLIASGSDAAHALAVFAGRQASGNPNLSAQKAEDAFVELMNQQARSIGLVNTHFVNCDGYTNYYHYTSMADLTTVAKVCLDTPLIRNTVNNSSARMTFTNGRYRTVYSTIEFLHSNSDYYIPEAIGLKTGTTKAAGACLLSTFYVNGRHLIIGVFNCPGILERYDDAALLFDLFKDYTPPVTEPPTEPSTGTTEAPTETTGPIEGPTETTGPIEGPTETTGPIEGPTETTGPIEGPTETTGPIEGPTETTGPSEDPTGSTLSTAATEENPMNPT